MTVSARSSPLAFFYHDRVTFREFPFEFARGDPGLGAGGSSSIAVEVSPGNFTVAWASHGSFPSVAHGSFPPAGFGYPPQPALTGRENWWPQGFHHAGRVSWSPNFGVVVSSVIGLLPSGEVVPHNYCFPFIPNRQRKWTFLAYSSQITDNRNPYGTNPNAWWMHLGFDIKRRKDLVAVETSVGTQQLEFYEISGSIPASRGAKVWQGTSGDRALGRSLWTEGGCQRIQIPWLGVWWVIQYGQSAPATDQIWGFSPTSAPASGLSAAPAGFPVSVPPEIHARAQAGGGNLHFVVDQMGRRVFGYQANTNVAPTVVGGVQKYPLLIWEVNPSTFEWLPVSLSPPLLVAVGSKVNLAPMAYLGGYRFAYFDQRDAASASWGSDLNISGNPIPAQVKRTGGFYVREIFIPKANAPRSMTWTQRTWSRLGGSTDWSGQKHVEMAFNTSDGRMYCFGGDHGSMGDTTLTTGSYTNQVLSFTPESGADLALRSPSCPAMRSINHPIRVDENGFQYRPASNEFFMMAGYSAGNWTNQCGWATRAEWEAAGGTNSGVWIWSVAGGWRKGGPMVPKAGFAGRAWTQGEDHCRRWYYDASADKLLAAAFGSFPDTALQTLTVQILDCTPNASGQFEFAKYRADKCANGPSGDVNKLPDGRPITDTVNGAIGMWRSDRAAVDPSTGHFYVYQPATGDVFRIHTRAGFWTFEGFPAARVEWVCRALPSGSRSYNLAHFIWAKNALWMFFQSGTGRLRAFSWTNGEPAPMEHPTPTGAVGTSVAKYVSGTDERICVIGNQTGSSWSSLLRSKLLHYYTITLS